MPLLTSGTSWSQERSPTNKKKTNQQKKDHPTKKKTKQQKKDHPTQPPTKNDVDSDEDAPARRENRNSTDPDYYSVKLDFFVATLLAPELCDGGSFLKTFTFLRQPLSGPLLLLGDAYMRIVSGCLG